MQQNNIKQICSIVSQTHMEVNCIPPSNIGAGYNVYLEMNDGTLSNGVNFNYDKPNIKCSSNCGIQPNVMNSIGGLLTICGRK